MMPEVQNDHPTHVQVTQQLEDQKKNSSGKDSKDIILNNMHVETKEKEEPDGLQSTSLGVSTEESCAINCSRPCEVLAHTNQNQNANLAQVLNVRVLKCVSEQNLPESKTSHTVPLFVNQQPLVASSKLLNDLKPRSWKGSIVQLDINGKQTLTEDIQTPKPNVPDGGWGWVIVFASACVTAIVGGSYIAFSLFYVELQEQFDTNKAVTGWIGSIYMATGNFLGIFFSVPVREYGSRPVCIVGAVVTCLGYIASSYATSIIYLYISFGIIAGAGVGMIALSTFVITQLYFDKKRALAAGIAISGFSLGVLISGPLIHFLVKRYTWRGAFLIMGAIFLQVIVFALLFRPLKVCLPRKTTESQSKGSHVQSAVANVARQLRAVFDFTLLKNLPFCLYLVAQFLGHIGLATFYQHIPSRAIHYGVPSHLVAFLPTITGVATGIARILMSFVANAPCTNRMLQYAVSLAAGGVCQCLMFLATDFISTGVMIALIGALNGGFFCIMTTILVDLHGIEHVARAQSLMSLVLGCSLLIATPFSGFIFDVTRDYNLPFLVTGLIQTVGAVCSFISFILIRHRVRRAGSRSSLRT